MEIDWQKTERILVVRLRSIGDTVLTTPSLISLRKFLPKARIDILLEDWVAPVMDGFDAVDNVITVSKSAKDRAIVARKLRSEKYDVAFNLHGGTTATFFVRASGAKHRVGYSNYRYSFLYNHLLSSSADFWEKEKTHSAEQQLALLGFVGVPVKERPKSFLAVTENASSSLIRKITAKTQRRNGIDESGAVNAESAAGSLGSIEGEEILSASDSTIALLHPVAAFATKQWDTEKFARIAEFLSEKGFRVAAVGTEKERTVLEKLKDLSKAEVITFDDLTLPEITALASRSAIFIGNDSGIAHIAAAVKTPSVVIFGSSNRDHWRPWTDAPNEIVYEEFSCQPCPGYVCEEFAEPKCILSVNVEDVKAAITRLI
ncbi:MAG: glycosyltransferase family 9 protein [Pyrinomonadaceae bacterium]